MGRAAWRTTAQPGHRPAQPAKDFRRGRAAAGHSDPRQRGLSSRAGSQKLAERAAAVRGGGATGRGTRPRPCWSKC